MSSSSVVSAGVAARVPGTGRTEAGVRGGDGRVERAMTDDAQVHRRATLYDGFVRLVELDVTYPPPDGEGPEGVFLEPRDAAAVLPVREDGAVVLARQYRPAVGADV